MKLFECLHCGQVLFFENTVCERCSHRLGYLPDRNALSSLEPDGTAWRALADPDQSYRFCANAAYDACNWLVPAEGPAYCRACRHNRTVPDLTRAENLVPWRKIEGAKHALIYSLLRLRLPLESRWESPERGLAFDFLADQPASMTPKVMTGHDNGLITIALAEADDAERERRRTAMGEPYRTLLGHFRHEVGHYYWDRLVRDGDALDACRALFGDDREDYNEAVQRHYREGAPPGWQADFISAYATTHPWEDFAETWAHYLHIVDTLEMAASFGVTVMPGLDGAHALAANVGRDPYTAADIRPLLEAWLPLTLALNSLNRCMGQPDTYPFVLSPTVIEKLGFIHDVIRRAAPARAC